MVRIDTPDDSVKTQDHTLGVCAKQFQSGDSRDLGSHRLQKKANTEMDSHRKLIALVCSVFCTKKENKTVDEVMAEKTE